jgi:hypothetical protein
MQQELEDTSKFKISLQSLDSRYADQRSCNNSEFKINLVHPLKNVMRLRLASIELPLVEYLFSNQYGNLTMAVRIGASTTFTKITPIQPGNYSANELITVLQSRLQNIHSQFTVTLNINTGRCMIRNTAVPFEAYLASYTKEIAARQSYWGLGYYLGFRNNRIQASQDVDGAWIIESTSVLNVQQNQYYLLQLYSPDAVVNVTHRLEKDGYLDAFAKVVLKNGYFTIAFDDNANLLRKEFTFLAPSSVPFFTVKLLNPFGEEVNMLNVDWSLTIEVTEVVNSKTYTTISKTYARM